MAGGVWRGLGMTFIILGAIALVLAIAAAGVGAYVLQEQTDAGVFADPDARDMGEIVLFAGAIGAGVGVVFLILGGIMVAVGGASARRELMRLLATRGEPRETPLAGKPGAAPRATLSKGLVVGVAAVVGLVAAFAVLSADQDGVPLASTLRPAAADGDIPPAATQRYDGHVRGARVPVIGGVNTDGASTVHVLDLAGGVYSIEGVLNWTVAPGGASTLILIMEAERSGDWEEIARAEGGPGLVLATPALEVPSDVRARIFVGGAGVADQGYELTITASPA